MNHLAMALVLLLADSSALAAEQFPAKPVRIVVPYVAGGASDIVSRVLADHLSRRWPSRAIVDNRPGAGTIIATQYVANAPADGYTLLLAQNTFITNPAVRDDLPFDTGKDFRAVAMVVTLPNVLVAHPGFPANNVKDLVAAARQQKAPVLFASTAPGGLLYLSTELLGRAGGFGVEQVSYNGSIPAMNDVMAGRIPLMFDGWYAVRSNVLAGKLKVIATFGDQRMQALPQVATINEAYPGLWAESFLGLVTRSGVPTTVVQILHSAIDSVVRSPEFVEKTAGQLGEPKSISPEDFDIFLRSQMEKWRDVARTANIKFK